jgi:hypothetical protein
MSTYVAASRRLTHDSGALSMNIRVRVTLLARNLTLTRISGLTGGAGSVYLSINLSTV